MLRVMLVLIGWVGVEGRAWACGGADESELGQAISAGVFEVIGSSPTHLALREFTNQFCDGDCPPACNNPGVPALAKKFAAVTGVDLDGSVAGITLHFVKYEPGVPVHLVRKTFEKSFPIYEPARAGAACTSGQAAAANLQNAKAFAASVGIDLKRPVRAERLKTPKLAAEACFPGTGTKDCHFSHADDSGGPEFAAAVYSLNNPAVCLGARDDEGCFMPSSTLMQVRLGFATSSAHELASRQLAAAVQITQDRRISNVTMSLEPMVKFSSGERQVLGVIFKFAYGCGAPAPSMHLVVVPRP